MIEIKSYSNGSYSYYSPERKKHINIPAELAKMILEMQKAQRSLPPHYVAPFKVITGEKSVKEDIIETAITFQRTVSDSAS